MDRSSKSLFVYGLCLVGPALAAGRPDGKDEGGLHMRPSNAAASSVATPVPMAAVSTQEAFSAIASLVRASDMRSIASVPSGAPASVQHSEPSSAIASVGTASSLAAFSVSAVKSDVSSAVSVVKSAASSVVASAKELPSIAHSGVSSAASAVKSLAHSASPSAAPSSATPSMIASSMALSAVSSVIAHSAASAKPEAPKTTPAPTTAKSTPYIDDWRTRATWPVGCEEWANPCPQGVPLEGGGTARTLSNNYVPVGSQSGYTNGFTSYLTMTNADGVVTGMPPVATLPAGLSKMPDWVTRTSPAPKPAAPSTMFVNPAPNQPQKSSKSIATAAHASQTAGTGMISTTNGAASLSATIGISFVFGLVSVIAVLW